MVIVLGTIKKRSILLKKKEKKKNFEMGSWDGLNNFHSVEIGLYACLYDLNFDLV